MKALSVLKGKVRLRDIDAPESDPPFTGFEVVAHESGAVYLKIGDAMHRIEIDVAQVICCLVLDAKQTELRLSREAK